MLPSKVAARILVVEDEVLIAAELTHRLRRYGYDIVGDEVTAEDAVHAARAKRPDLVLMDIRLRGSSDGINAAERIRNELDTPVVYLTAHSDEATLRRAKASLPFGYVLKPFQEKDLVVTIEIALQRHAVEQRLRESEARYATTLKSIGDGVIATDVERRITFMNPVAEMLTGWTLADAGGEPVDRVVQLSSEAGPAAEPHPIQRALEQRRIVHVQEAMGLLDRCGGTIPIEDSASPILDAGGELTGAVMAFRDCREKLKARAALAKAEKALQEARRVESIGRLAGGLAHDFNNMIAVITNCCELLERKLPAGSVEAGLVREIFGAGGRASSLIDQLLTYSRRRVLEPHLVDINSLMWGVESLLRRLAGESIVLDLQPYDRSLHVSLDRSQFERVFVNLTVNACDAMEAGGGRLTITIDRVEVPPDEPDIPELDAGSYAVVRMHDTGHGMDEETRARIFEPFFTTKPAGRGTGLGLATVYGAVKQSGGHVEVSSVKGEGTTFSVFLPLAAES